MNDDKHRHLKTNSGYEKSDVNIKNLFLVTAIIILIIIIIVIAMNELFIAEKEQQIYKSVLKPESAELRELTSRETEALQQYKLLDEKSNIYQIPIDRAMELLADESFQSRLKQNIEKR